MCSIRGGTRIQGDPGVAVEKKERETVETKTITTGQDVWGIRIQKEDKFFFLRGLTVVSEDPYREGPIDLFKMEYWEALELFESLQSQLLDHWNGQSRA